MTKILVIEDASELRDDVVEMLTLEGYEAIGAENGRVGVEKAKDNKPDLIVCDIMMPELDGYEVLEVIRQDPKTATIPFIFLTAKTDRANWRDGMVLGADDYLTKPFLITELMDSIQTQLNRREEFRRNADERLEELRENIITSLPHELRTPLNTIIGFSDMLLAEAQRLKPDQVADWASHINIAAHRLYRVTENYLYYTRVQTTAEKMREQNANEITQDAHLVVEAKALRIAKDYERKDDLHIAIQPASVLQIAHQDVIKIVQELIDNAFKFSAIGTPVHVTGTQEEGNYRICIEDEGRGIKQENIDEIGAFVQHERGFYEQQGIGLGLVIAKSLIEMYGGEFRIRPRESKGTIVCINLANHA